MAVQSIVVSSALPMALAVIPSLPMPVLARLVARMIDRLDELDGDPDLEDTREDFEDGHDAEQEFWDLAA